MVPRRQPLGGFVGSQRRRLSLFAVCTHVCIGFEVNVGYEGDELRLYTRPYTSSFNVQRQPSVPRAARLFTNHSGQSSRSFKSINHRWAVTPRPCASPSTPVGPLLPLLTLSNECKVTHGPPAWLGVEEFSSARVQTSTTRSTSGAKVHHKTRPAHIANHSVPLSLNPPHTLLSHVHAAYIYSRVSACGQGSSS